MTSFHAITGRPLIGITGRRLPSSELGALEVRYQRTAINMYFADFAQAVHRAGGLPVELPYEAATPELVGRLDGLVVSGGQDVDPDRWNGPAECAKGPIDTARDAYETVLIQAALETGTPVLGVCRGAQLINVVLGGTLVADLPADELDHVSTGEPVHVRTHTVTFEPGSLCERLYGASATVNSLHHQAVATPGQGVIVTGRAKDGVAEAFEVTHKSVLGVQWHPEWLDVDPSFRWLVHTAVDRTFGCLETPRLASRVQTPDPQALSCI